MWKVCPAGATHVSISCPALAWPRGHPNPSSIWPRACVSQALVPIAPPVEQPHLERERCRAAAELRTPLAGGAAFKNLPLTGAFQSVFPAYRQRASFGLLGDVAATASASSAPASSSNGGAPQPAVGGSSAPGTSSNGGAPQPAVGDSSASGPFVLDGAGQIIAVLNPDGTQSTDEDQAQDALQWASCFGEDVFHNHCSNHEHDCHETCIKYVKKKLEAHESLRSRRVPSCRFWFFHVCKVGLKNLRRRGKPLVQTPYIEEVDERNQQHRCQVKREQPFRSTSQDVAQASDRCNVDWQFLPCAPPEPPEPVVMATTGGALQLAAEAKKRRLNRKTATPTCSPGLIAAGPEAVRARIRDHPKWFYAGCRLSPQEQELIKSFAASFRKAYCMDFYITKYQGKPMEALAPLFQAMNGGIRRLEQEEREKEEDPRATKQHCTIPWRARVPHNPWSRHY